MPNKLSKSQITISIIVLAVLAVLGIKYFVGPGMSGPTKLDISRVKGDVQAPIRVTEYIDYQCPACAMGSQFLKTYMKENPGKVLLELKYFPLKNHHHAFIAARFNECAARQDKFWPYHDLLIDRQNQWKTMVNAYPAFDQIAKDLQLNLKNIYSCLQDKTIDDVINEHKAEGKSLGVRSTPTYFINDKMVVGLKSLREEIERLK